MSGGIEDGGPAFPEQAVYDGGRGEVNPAGAYGFACGMTLRDYFAAKAMQQMLASPCEWAEPNSATLGELISQQAYEMADEMLKARKK